MDNKPSIEPNLSYKLFLQRESQVFHQPYDEEMAFYDAVKNGDFDKLKKYMNPLTGEGLGKLSTNPLRNIKYHLIITIAMITRFCIEGGMKAEDAYTLSDIYIQQIDLLPSIDEVTQLHREVIYEFTSRMKKIKSRTGISKNILKATEYIYDHLNEKISLDELSDYLGMNKSYFCELFKKEIGSTVNDYILNLKIEAAEKMLMYTSTKAIDISNYLAFSSHSHFISVFKKYTGQTPNNYRRLHIRQYFAQDEK